MFVSLKPFNVNIKLDNKYSQDEFFDYLKANPVSCEIVHKQRLLFVDDMNDDYFVGFMLSKKDFASHCRYEMVDGKLKITVDKIEEGAEYNFFILNKNSLNGVYLTYSVAATIKTLEKTLKQCMHDWFFSKGIVVNNGTWKKNNIVCSPILSQETIDSVLNKLSEISSMTFVDVKNSSGLFRPDFLKKTRYSLQFDKKKMGSIVQVRKLISDFVKSKKAVGVSVKGKDNANEIDTINFDCLTTTWKSYDYDNLTKDIVTIDNEDLGSHKIPQDMLNVINLNPKYKAIIENQ